MESVVENVTKEGKFVDRTKVCPLLIRVFVGQDGHNVISDYSRGNTPAHELQLYTWMDTSLKELMGLIRSMGELGRSRGSTFDFTVVYADPRSPNFKMRDIGKTVVGEPGLDDNSTLAFKKFQNGDFIDVAITTRKRFKGNRFNRNDNRFGGRNGEKFAFKRITYKGEDGEGERVLRGGGDEEKGSRRGADGGERGARKDEGERRMKRRGDDGERGMRRRGDDGDRGMRRGGDDGDRGMRRGGDDGDRAMRRGGDDGEGGARRGERDRPY